MLIGIQFFLILIKIQPANSKTYLITEIIFKISLALFIEYFLYTRVLDGILYEDKIIFGFAGALLAFDAIVNNIPHLLKEYNIHFTFFGKN
jgi:hypothetical protein